MRLLNKTFFYLTVFTLTIFLTSCSSGCDNQNPTAKVTNNGADKVSVQIKTTGGSTVNINNIDPNTSSTVESYAPGQVTFVIVLKDLSEVTETVAMNFCTDYVVNVNQDNSITTTSSSRD